MSSCCEGRGLVSVSRKTPKGLCNNSLGPHIMHIYIKFARFLLLVPCPIFPLTIYTQSSCIMQIAQEDRSLLYEKWERERKRGKYDSMVSYYSAHTLATLLFTHPNIFRQKAKRNAMIGARVYFLRLPRLPRLPPSFMLPLGVNKNTLVAGGGLFAFPCHALPCQSLFSFK